MSLEFAQNSPGQPLAGASFLGSVANVGVCTWRQWRCHWGSARRRRTIINRISKLAATVVATGGMVLAGLGLAANASAQGPSYNGGNCPPGVTCTHWLPGQPPPPGGQVLTWDWNVPHDWYWNSEGIVDVTTNTMYPWSGSPHPAAPPPPGRCASPTADTAPGDAVLQPAWSADHHSADLRRDRLGLAAGIAALAPRVGPLPEVLRWRADPSQAGVRKHRSPYQ